MTIEISFFASMERSRKYEGVRVEPEGWDAVFGVWADKNIAVLVEPQRLATWDHTKWVS